MAADAGLIAMAYLIPGLVDALRDAASRFRIETQTDALRYKQVCALFNQAERRLARVESGP